MKTPTHEQIIQAAKNHKWVSEGVLEIDDNAKISRIEGSDAGAYVQSWLWIADEDVKT